MNTLDLTTLQRKFSKQPGILGREQYFNSAILIPLVRVKQEYHFLLQKRASHIRQGGEICFPGGEHDPLLDADYHATAIRETQEELGLSQEHISIIGRLDTLLTPHGVLIEPFVGVLNLSSLTEITPEPNEVDRIFTLPVTFFEQTQPEEYAIRIQMQSVHIDEHGKETILLPVKELGLPERYASSWGGRTYRVLVYHTPQEVIWGITAKLIYYFLQRLQQEES
jgi:8-oxo-dGTP pyrophosphatase MutT (NUDIX family)